MKKAVIVFALLVMIAGVASAATLRWSQPTRYTNDTSITTSDRAKIVYECYSGASADGPWNSAAVTAAGITNCVVPEPAAGATLFYTVDASLNGQRGAKATAVSKSVPFSVPAAPGGLIIE